MCACGASRSSSRTGLQRLTPSSVRTAATRGPIDADRGDRRRPSHCSEVDPGIDDQRAISCVM